MRGESPLKLNPEESLLRVNALNVLQNFRILNQKPIDILALTDEVEQLSLGRTVEFLWVPTRAMKLLNRRRCGI